MWSGLRRSQVPRPQGLMEQGGRKHNWGLKGQDEKQAPLRNWEGNTWALGNVRYDLTLRVIPTSRTVVEGVNEESFHMPGSQHLGAEIHCAQYIRHDLVCVWPRSLITTPRKKMEERTDYPFFRENRKQAHSSKNRGWLFFFVSSRDYIPLSLVRIPAWKKYPVASDILQFSPHPLNPPWRSSRASETLPTR